MLNVLTAANEMGYMDIPSNTLIDLNEIKRFKPEEITIVTTGSQGEPMSALYRMAYAEHDKVQVSENDLVVIADGTEKFRTPIDTMSAWEFMSLQGVTITGFDKLTERERTVLAYYIYHR